ncbi:MAG: hypothetical protein ACJ77K_08765 [Bacteroidia bacterium]|jgi:hypothetical protein
MRRFFLLLLSVLALKTSAQPFSFPKIDSTGRDASEFIPPGWFVEHSASGDLNNDKTEDLVLVIQSKDSITELRYNCETKKWDDEERGFPRILIVLFEGLDGKYHLAFQNNDFILRSDEGGMMGDPFEGQEMKIRNNVLTFGFSGGTSERWVVEYKFRYQKSNWFLIGASSGGFHAVLGTAEENSYNFLTGKVKITTSVNIFENGKSKIKWKTIPKADLRTINMLVRPFCWEVEPGVFL